MFFILKQILFDNDGSATLKSIQYYLRDKLSGNFTTWGICGILACVFEIFNGYCLIDASHDRIQSPGRPGGIIQQIPTDRTALRFIMQG